MISNGRAETHLFGRSNEVIVYKQRTRVCTKTNKLSFVVNFNTRFRVIANGGKSRAYSFWMSLPRVKRNEILFFPSTCLPGVHINVIIYSPSRTSRYLIISKVYYIMSKRRRAVERFNDRNEEPIRFTTIGRQTAVGRYNFGDGRTLFRYFKRWEMRTVVDRFTPDCNKYYSRHATLRLFFRKSARQHAENPLNVLLWIMNGVSVICVTTFFLLN